MKTHGVGSEVFILVCVGFQFSASAIYLVRGNLDGYLAMWMGVISHVDEQNEYKRSKKNQHLLTRLLMTRLNQRPGRAMCHTPWRNFLCVRTIVPRTGPT